MSTTQMVLSFVIGPIVGGVLVFYLQSRIRVREVKDTTEIRSEATAAATPYQLLQQQLVAKDQQIAQARGEHHTFVENSMKRNDAATTAILELAGLCRAQSENLKDVGTALQAHREEASARSGKIYEQIGKVNERLAGLEANVRNSLDTASDAARHAKEAAELAEKAVREARAA